jgi:hypothetical protein
VGCGEASHSGNLRGPGRSDVQRVLSQIHEQSGSLTLDLVDGPELGAQSLQVHTENGLSALTLVEDTGAYCIVRSFIDHGATPGKIRIRSYEWDRRLICADFQIVNRAFDEFLTAGAVPRELMD